MFEADSTDVRVNAVLPLKRDGISSGNCIIGVYMLNPPGYDTRRFLYFQLLKVLEVYQVQYLRLVLTTSNRGY